jgi:hypothetical protein
MRGRLLVVGILAVGLFAAQSTGVGYYVPKLATAAAPGGVTTVASTRGFDVCDAPSVDTMQKWWSNSPFYYVGIYIGGGNRSCPQSQLDANWVSSVYAQGWNFLQIQVGPQAPCWPKTGEKMSTDPVVAKEQGRSQANRAADQSAALGFGPGNTIIYYDMEGYDVTNATCHTAVKAFLNGWTAEMQDIRARKSGIYGSCLGGASAWAALNRPPNAAWVAREHGDPLIKSVYKLGTGCLADGDFPQRRVKQFNLDTSESYGGVSMFIDINCADGLVAGDHSSVPYDDCFAK